MNIATSRNKKKFRTLCSKEISIPIFIQAWWLDAVCGKDNWDVVIAEKGGVIQAAIPYYMPKPGFIMMPPLTQSMGVWYRPIDGKADKQLSREKELANTLIDALPSFQYFAQNFHYSIGNWQPFYWRGFKQTTRYTYIIPDISDLEAVVTNFSHAKRKNLKKAEQKVNINFDLDKESFYNNHAMTLGKQGAKIQYSRDLFYRIYDSAYENNSGRTIYATDSNNNLHSALFVVWDSMSAYDLISTIDPDFRNSGSATLLIREMIKYVSQYVRVFDFEGSMIEPVANSFRQFGTIAMPYFSIWKGNRSLMFKAYMHIKGRLSTGSILKK
jgi:hypothetical protein